MEFSLAFNGDIELIQKANSINLIECYFGTASQNPVGSGRPVSQMANVDRRGIEDAVRLAHSAGKKFNYLVNAACMGNMEYTGKKLNQIMEQFDWLVSAQVDMVTLANPVLIDLCRKRYPNLKISVSSFAMVDSIEAAKFYNSLGVHEITVRNGIERDFRLLEKMQAAISCNLQVMVNQVCLYHCPYQQYHNNVISHMSQYTVDEKISTNYCTLHCLLQKYREPENLLRSTWCRPEDLHFYEEIGIRKYKLTDRNKSSSWLLRTADAYCSGKYEGNLSEILNMNHFQNKQMMHGKHVSKTDLKTLRSLMQLEIDIDNQKLDGFMEHFLTHSCNLQSCRDCGYCRGFAQRTLRYDAARLERSLSVLEAVAEEGVAI